MRIKHIINGGIIATAVAFLVALAFHVTAGIAMDSVAVLKTTGMTCASCSNKITDALRSQKGVAVTEVDVEGGWVIIGYDTKATKPEALAKKVTDSGFGSNVHLVLTPEQFKLTTGRYFGNKTDSGSGCCGGKGGGCGTSKKS
jgi:copper chaperone CopZ